MLYVYQILTWLHSDRGHLVFGFLHLILFGVSFIFAPNETTDFLDFTCTFCMDL